MFSISPKSIKYLETSRGIAFTATLFEDGKKVGIVENRGNGGETFARIGDPKVNQRLGLASAANDVAVEWYLESLMDVAERV